MRARFIAPAFDSLAFTCPHCWTLAEQFWIDVTKQRRGESIILWTDLAYSQCSVCGEEALWRDQQIIIPSHAAEAPHEMLPSSIAKDYLEASAVAAISPRSAAALLRLCIQKLCKELGGAGTNINDDIALMVSQGLPIKIQQALDVLRVIGNEQVHPGTLDISDEPALVTELFRLVNLIVENRIVEPRAIQQMYERLPESKRKAIEVRDTRNKAADA